MKNEWKKITILLGLVFIFSVMTIAQIWIPWEEWNDEIKINPCKNGRFHPDGGERFFHHVPEISGNCYCFPGYRGDYCEIPISENE